jgi:hypothetical protein
MKTIPIASVLILLAGCSVGTRTANQASSRRPQAVLSQERASASTPTVILSAAHDPVGRRRTIYEDTDYMFVAMGYGPKGKQIPGLFVFSQKMNKWMEIKKLSTQGAKLGRSPNPEEERKKGAFCSVGWDYSRLGKTDYAAIPLMTSGSLNFPDKIRYEGDTATYLLQFNSSWNIDAVLTQFIVKKDDFDKAFGEEAGKVP